MQVNDATSRHGKEHGDRPVPGVTPARVLLAEDDAALRAVLVSALERDGYEVIAASGGGELVRYLSASILRAPRVRPPDLVVSDIRMPGPSGLQILRGLREADWNVPMILITAFGDPETHREARRLGALALFDKPFDIDDLRSAVQAALPRRPA